MRHFVLISLACATLTSCGEKQPAAEAPQGDGKTVLTTFYPIQYFAERIAGGQLSIECPVPDDADPIFWRPDRSALQRYQAADLILVNGADFEKWTATASLPENRIVDTSKSFEQDFITYKVETTHKHGKDGEEHTHSGIDGHTWLDPNNAKIQAATIHQAFAKNWPEHAAEFEKNFQGLVSDLDELDVALKELKVQQALLASHPAYNYLARRYAWQVTNLDLDPETMPRKGVIPADNQAKIILWESAPREMISKLLSEKHDLRGVVFSPIESKAEQDYLAAFKANIERLRSVLN